MQKKLLVTLISGAFAGGAGVAQAGPISIASVVTYASEAITAAAAINFPGVAYSLTNPLASPSSQKARFTVDAGSITLCPTLTFSGTAGAVVTVGAGTVVSSGAVCEYTVDVATAPVPSNATLNFTGGSVTAVTPLSAAGGVLNVTVSVLDLGNNVVESNTGVVARSANAWQFVALSSGSLSPAETAKINVAADPPSSAFTVGLSGTTSTVNLGRVRVTEVAGAQVAPNGTTSVDFATASNELLNLTVTGTFAATATLFVAGSSNCTGSLATFTINTARTSATVSGLDINSIAAATVSGQLVKDVFVCYAENTNSIPPSQFVASAGTFNASAAAYTTVSNLDPTNLYNLTLNGAQVDIRNYVPDGFAGWLSAYRIINTGVVPAAVRGQFILQNGTLHGSAQPITATIPPGGVVVVSSGQVEGVLGAAPPDSGVGPRLRMTAETDSLTVQSFACQPNGNCFLNSDGQQGTSAAAAN
jgi:hypothetical protein